MNQYRLDEYLLGTQITITANTLLPKVDLVNALNKAMNEFHKVAAQFTRFNDTSELSMLNKSQDKFVHVSDELFEMIEQGLEISSDTDGLFDLTVIDILETYGYNRNYDFSKLKDKNLSNEIKQLAATRPKWSEIHLNKEKKQVRLAPNQRLDLGSIAKGFAIRQASSVLGTHDIANHLINAGGDIYANGKNHKGRPWSASIFNPMESTSNLYKSLGSVALNDQALCVSGSWARKVGNFHHLINPQSALPQTNDVLQTVTIGKDPMITDALSTAIFLTGPKGFDILEKYNVQAMVLTTKGELIVSPSI